ERARGRPAGGGNEVHKAGLARPRRADDGDPVAGHELKRGAVEGDDGGLTLPVRLGQAFGPDDGVSHAATTPSTRRTTRWAAAATASLWVAITIAVPPSARSR